jgi:hypothetical protein
MELTSTSIFVEIARLLFLMLAVSYGFVAAASFWRRRTAAVSAVQKKSSDTPSAGAIVYNDAPTVRVVDSQRVDRLRKVSRLTVGEFIDVLETRIDTTPRFRVTLKALVRRNDADAAHVAVEFGGTTVSCGPLVEEVAFNEFILPRGLRDEPRNAIFHFHEHGDNLDFMRIKLRSVDVQSGSAELDMLQVSGSWPAGA